MFLTFNDQQRKCQDDTGDTNSDILTIFKRELNIATSRILHELGLYTYEGNGTLTSVADQQRYDLPVKNVRVKSVTYTSGDTPYVVDEISDRREWLALNEITTYSSTWPEFYFIENDTILFFPIPDTAGDTITVRQEERSREMTLDDYTTGTVTTVNGDETIEGSGTSWATATNIRDDCWLKVDTDGLWYEIDTITDADTLELKKAYEGVSGSSLAYTIGEQPLGPYEDLHVLPVYWALMTYYGSVKENTRLFNHYSALWTEGWNAAKTTYAKPTSSNVISSKHMQRSDYRPEVVRTYV